MKKVGEKLSFTSLAVALASDYLSVYVINTKDDSYVEYKTDGADEELIPISEGDDFYKDVTKNCPEQVWPEDQEYFLNTFKKEAVINALNEGKSFTLNYRLNIDGKPKYFFLKTIRAGENCILVAVRDVDIEKCRELESTAKIERYSQIAGTLASRYEAIYRINIDTDEYIRFSSSEKDGVLEIAKRGEDFFADSVDCIIKNTHPDDVNGMLDRFRKENLIFELKELGFIAFSYRRFLDGEYQYMKAIIVKSKNDHKHIVMGVFNNTAQIKREELIATKGRAFSDVSMALVQQYEVIFRINSDNNDYTVYASDEKYSKLKKELGLDGTDFFADTKEIMKAVVHEEDYPMMEVAMNKNSFVKSIVNYGKVILNYRMLIGGKFYYTSLFAVQSKENPNYIVVAVANVDEAKRMEIAYTKAMDIANRDALTGVKNKRAYVQAEVELDEQIRKKVQSPFAIVVCDINGLKQVNDIQGHKAGDEFIKNSCLIICDVFSHSPVFRIGGDEFAVILKGKDYDQRYELIKQLGVEQEEKRVNGIKPIAVGLSDFDSENDIRVQDVFERADSLMYDDKKKCKSETDNIG